jgi:hypothetical protein
VNESEEEMFDFMSGYEEEESEGGVETIKDFEYPLADERGIEKKLVCAQ